MRETPSHNDEQPEYPPITYPRQRRRELEAGRKPPIAREAQNTYHSDEHPYVPKVKRASRYIEEQETRPFADAERDAEIKRKRAASPDAGETLRRPTGKVPLPPSRRPPTTPPLHRPRRPLPQASFGERLLDLKHNKPLMLLMLIALAILITLVPFMVNGLRSQSSGILPGSGNQSNSTSASVGQPPSNPHELVITPQDIDHPAPPVFATSAYLLDADTGATLYAYNPFMHLPMLSTTKLMTAVLAVEHGNPDQQITINNAMSHDISQLAADSSLFGIKKGETYSLRDLLYGLLLPSGNDAAVAIADAIGGNLTNFVAMMNQRARQLGMYDTHYMNPHGLLDTDHYSSAHDLAVLGRYSMNIPLIQQITATKIYHMPKGGNHPDRYVVNGNQFLWWYPGVNGGKPGWDGASNFVQVVSVVRNNHHLIGVTMHTNDWWTDMRNLMNWGFDNFTWISPYDVDFQHPIPYDNQWNYFVRDKKTNTIPTADKGRYYNFTGYSISGSIMAYFDQAGGLNHFGYPVGMPDVTQSPTISQKFEHATILCDTTSKQCRTA